MTINQEFRRTISRLKGLYPEHEAVSIAKLVFEELGVPTGPLSGDDTKNFPPEKGIKLEGYLHLLLNSVPVQYVLGHAYFMDVRFLVSEACLIPRQETEQLVDLILRLEKNSLSPLVLDIGTGSGCIALSLSGRLDHARIFASDISDEALKIARENARIQNAHIDFIRDNILQPENSLYPEDIDIIVSNPPYVRNSEKEHMHRNVIDNEPVKALFVDDADPLVFYREICRFGRRKLKKGGRLYFEINEAFGREMMQLMDELGYKGINIWKDLNDKDRFISAYYE